MIFTFLTRRAARLNTQGRKPFPAIVAYMLGQRGVAEHGRKQGAAISLSYPFGR
jgi:hypothetical protein